MVRTCSNPTCGRPFHYFHEGRLFRLEADPTAEARHTRVIKSVEYFWLCDQCSTSMALRLSDRGHVEVQPFAPAAARDAVRQALMSRHGGLLLRSVAIGARRPQDQTIQRLWPSGSQTAMT